MHVGYGAVFQNPNNQLSDREGMAANYKTVIKHYELTSEKFCSKTRQSSTPASIARREV